MTGRLGRLAIAAALASAPGVAWADWIADGVFEYVDREYDTDGFTGVEPPRPVRFADVEVVDANRNGNSAIIGRGATAADGSFSILVEDTKTRDVYVRVLTRSEETADLFVSVQESSGNNGALYAAATETIEGHGPTTSVDFGTLTIPLGQGAEPFNIYDMLVVGADFLAVLNGSRPAESDSVTAVWGYANGLGSAYYAGFGTLMLRDSAGFDDTVILHEMGHFAVDRFSDSDTPGGSHGFTQCKQDLRLAYDEGFATYWGNAALRHHGVANSHVYLRSNGGPGPGNAVRSADLEGDGRYPCRGSASEVNVFKMLWDITDGETTADASPGVEESHDLIELGDGEIWEVIVGHIAANENVTFQSFWDGWFLPPAANGRVSEMIALGRELAINHFVDPFEPNDDPSTAAPISPSGYWLDVTLFNDPELDGTGTTDVDLFAFDADPARSYRLLTLDLTGETDTRLELLDTDGSSVLVENDDVSPDDPASAIAWSPSSPGRYFLRVSQVEPLAVYGSCRVQVIVDRDRSDPLAEPTRGTAVHLARP